MKKLTLLFFIPIILLSQDFKDQSLEDFSNKVVLDILSFDKKIDSLLFIQSKSDNMVIFYDNNYIKAQEIIEVGSDSLKLELLDFKRFQWKTNIKGRNNQKSSFSKKIAIDDINMVYYNEINFKEHILIGIIVTSTLFYLTFSPF